MSDDRDARLAAALERLGNGLRVHVQSQATEHGLSPLQFRITVLLGEGGADERRRVGALAVDLGVAQPTVSRAVTALERKGLIGRDSPDGDARSSPVALTAAGQRLHRALTSDRDAVSTLLTDIDPSDKDAALVVVLELIAGLHRRGAITVARTCTTCRFLVRHAAGPSRFHCDLLELPLSSGDLRIDCPEHEPATSSRGR